MSVIYYNHSKLAYRSLCISKYLDMYRKYAVFVCNSFVFDKLWGLYMKYKAHKFNYEAI